MISARYLLTVVMVYAVDSPKTNSRNRGPSAARLWVESHPLTIPYNFKGPGERKNGPSETDIPHRIVPAGKGSK